MKRLYVIKLGPDVMKDRRFARANPGYVHGKPCVYVGSTGRDPKLRFEQHMTGYKAARIVTNYGFRLMRPTFTKLPVQDKDITRRERALAEKYRARGWGVWQN